MSEKIKPFSVEEEIEEYRKRENFLTEKFSSILFSEAVLKGRQSFLESIQDKVVQPERILEMMRDYIEVKLFAFIELHAISQFTYMEITGNWTEAGQDRVRLSFIRLLLNIPSHEEVTYTDYKKFDEKISQLKIKYDIQNKSKENIEHTIFYPEISLLGRKFTRGDTREINTILQAIGSARRVFMSGVNFDCTLLFGVASTRQYGMYHVHFFVREDMRTPGVVSYIVASIQDKDIFIRMEACRYVFYSKWVPVWDGDIFAQKLFRIMDEENISEAIKVSVIQAFHAESRDEFITKETEFLNAMMDNFLYHELAHNVLKDVDLT